MILITPAIHIYKNTRYKMTEYIFIYVLLLEDNKYYVGRKYDEVTLDKRLFEYACSSNLEWLQKYKPIEIHQVTNVADIYDENKTVLRYMNTYGIHNVRGGSFTSLSLKDYEIVVIRSMLPDIEDTFYENINENKLENNNNKNEQNNFVPICKQIESVENINFKDFFVMVEDNSLFVHIGKLGYIYDIYNVKQIEYIIDEMDKIYLEKFKKRYDFIKLSDTRTKVELYKNNTSVLAVPLLELINDSIKKMSTGPKIINQCQDKLNISLEIVFDNMKYSIQISMTVFDDSYISVGKFNNYLMKKELHDFKKQYFSL